MSSDIAIRVEGLSKKYLLQHEVKAEGLRHVLQETIAQPFRKVRSAFQKRRDGAAAATAPARFNSCGRDSEEEFWALRDVTFEILRGEVVGIIGRNGAGKSTLLKILSRITEPTSGRIELDGRVASLLEVGTGFHHELTGRENIFLNGAILGMTRNEVRRKFDQIVAFAEVEKFLDTPVKRYSSGMYVRLAFAVAAHLEPEILVVDEVLAVGDAQFQKKCLGKMQEVSQAGRTVLFVSHNMAAVSQLTTKGIVLERGGVRFVGPTEQAIEHYSSGSANDMGVYFDVSKLPRKYKGTLEAQIVSLRFERPLPIFSFGEDFRFIAQVNVLSPLRRLRFSMTVFTAEGSAVGSCFGPELEAADLNGQTEFQVMLPKPRLAPGQYYCGIAIGKGDHRTGHIDYDVVLNTMPFEVRSEEGEGGTVAFWTRGWGATVLPSLEQCLHS